MHSNAAGVSIDEVGKLLAQAFLKSTAPVNIISGFRFTGIHPINSLIFGDHEFSPSTVTDQLMLNNKSQSIEPPPPLSYATNVELTTPQPSTSKVTFDKRVVIPGQLLPLPKAAPRTKSNWQKVKSSILTDTPEKTENRKRAREKIQQGQRKKKGTKDTDTTKKKNGSRFFF